MRMRVKEFSVENLIYYKIYHSNLNEKISCLLFSAIRKFLKTFSNFIAQRTLNNFSWNVDFGNWQ
jgi:hypothetical protein